MWIMTNKGFVSVVRHRTEVDKLMICAREKSHLTSLLPDYMHDQIYSIPFSDYAYRINVLDDHFAMIINKMIIDIEYDEFKKSVKNNKLSDFYLHVWDLGVKYFGFGPKEIIEKKTGE